MATDDQPSSQNQASADTRVGGAHGFSALPTGARLDRYVVESVIAAGGFGITYIARHETLGRIVAIKEHFPRQFAFRDGATSEVRPTDPPTYTWALDRFLQEGRSLGRCKHPNVVDVTDVFEANGTAYMVLGYEDGTSLKTWRDQLGRMPTQAEVDAWLYRLLDALEFVHDAGLLHRDLAPDNILIRSNNTPCLIDFGAARQALAERSQMMSAIVKGGFSPPEQYTSSGRSQGPWSDIYALGATLYRTLTGRTPPEATERQLEDELKPIGEVLPDGHGYRPGFLAGIDRALRLRIADRPQSVGELRTILMSSEAPAETSTAAAATAPSERNQNIAEPKASDGKACPRQVSFTEIADAGTGATAGKDPRRFVPWLVASSIVLMLLGVAAWSLLRSDETVTVAQSSRPASPAPAPVAAAPPVPSPRLGASQAVTASPPQPSGNTSDNRPPQSAPPSTQVQAPPPRPTPPATPTVVQQPRPPATPDVLPPALAGLLSDRDRARINNLETSKPAAIAAARAVADRDDDQREGQAALAQVLRGSPQPISDGDLSGNWRCRSVQIDRLGVFAYTYFRCQITRSGDGFQLHKVSGSQRKIGRFVRIDRSSFLYLGQSYIDGDKVPTGYDGNNEHDEVGILVKPASGRFRLELPEQRSGIEFIELVK